MKLRSEIHRGARRFLTGLLAVGVCATLASGDEPSSRLGRLFRFGFGSTSAGSAPTRPPVQDLGSPVLGTGASAPPTFSTPEPNPSAAPRIVPRPRVTRAATDADPIVTRVALGRSNDGTPFGMFLQVFADGTVLDSEGEHHVGRDALRPILEALQSGDLYRLKGHCGAPSADFIEQVHIVVYERSLGRLRASAFSYSGNPDGCEHSVRHLHVGLEALQAKISRPATTTHATDAMPPPTMGQPLPSTDHHTIIPLTPGP